MPNTILTYVYTSDLGKRYRIGMNSEVATQLVSGVSKVGAELWDGSEVLDGMPGNMRPRQVKLVHPTNGTSRYVAALSADCPLFNPLHDTPATTLNLEDSDGSSATYTKDGTLGEKQRKRHKRS